MIGMIRLKLICAIFFMILATSVLEAKENTFYFGGSYGSASFTGDNLTDSNLESGSNLSESSNAYKLLLGYNAAKWISFELGYIHFNSVKDEFNLDPNKDFLAVVSPPSSLKIKANGFSIAPIFHWNIRDNFSMSAKVGASILSVDRDFFPGVLSSVESSSKTETTLFGGIGANYRLTSNLAISLEYERYRVSESDVDTLLF